MEKNTLLSNKHKIFADEYIRTGDKTDAYQKAYPKCSRKSAYTKSGDLLKNVEVQAYIKEIQTEINNKAINLITGARSAEVASNILSADEKRTILAKIARGEHDYEDVLLIKGEPKKIKRKPNFIEISKAIEVDNKMSGDIAPTKIAQTDTKGNDSIKKEGDNLIFVLDLGSSI